MQGRRRFLTTVGVACGAIAGCTGSINDGTKSSSGKKQTESIEPTFAGNAIPEHMAMDALTPRSTVPMANRLEDQTDGSISPNLAVHAQICGEQACSPKLMNNVVQTANMSLMNSSAHWPENDVFTMPNIFPPEELAAQSYMMTHAETWEKYWVPFAKKYGVLPIAFDPPATRELYLGKHTNEKVGKHVRDPSEIEGLKMRRTKSRVAQIAMEQWDAIPQDISWGDTAQALRTGVVDGMETWTSPALTFGMKDAIGQVILCHWAPGLEVQYANVDWLKRLSEESRSKVASVSKTVTEDLVKVRPEVMEQRVGLNEPPAKGTALEEAGIEVSKLSDDQLTAWHDPIDPRKNPDLYEEITKQADELTGLDGTFEFLSKLSRESSVPDMGQFSVDSWWDEHLHKI